MLNGVRQTGRWGSIPLAGFLCLHPFAWTVMDRSKTPAAAAAAPSPKEGELEDDDEGDEDEQAEEELVWFGSTAAARALLSSGEIQLEETPSPGGRAWYNSIRRRSSAVKCAFGCIGLDTAKSGSTVQ